jgi:hypothetical protein
MFSKRFGHSWPVVRERLCAQHCRVLHDNFSRRSKVAAAHDSCALPAPFWQTVRYTPGSVPARTGQWPRMAVCTYREPESDMFHFSWSTMSACSWETRSIRTSTRNMHCMPLKVEEFSFCVLGVDYVLTLDLSSSCASSPVPSGGPLEPPILLPPF